MRPAHVRASAVAATVAWLASGCEAPPRRDPPRGTPPPTAAAPAPVPPPAPRPAAARDTARAAARPSPRRSRQAPAPRPASAARPRACTVELVQDGDTIRCRGGERVRLLLIDTPELTQRPFGDQARRALARLVPPGTRVTLETDRQPRDRFGRLLAYVRAPDSSLVNEAMLDSGYAVVLYYSPNGLRRAEFEAAEAAARAAGRGLHAEGGFACSPIEHRRKRC